MKLGKKQELFMRLLPRLIDKAHALGYEVRGGDLFRDPRTHGEYGENIGYSHPYSNHKLKCAIDLLLFLNGKYLRKTTEYKELGSYWESLHKRCRWGGRYNDGNHFELV